MLIREIKYCLTAERRREIISKYDDLLKQFAYESKYYSVLPNVKTLLGIIYNDPPKRIEALKQAGLQQQYLKLNDIFIFSKYIAALIVSTYYNESNFINTDKHKEYNRKRLMNKILTFRWFCSTGNYIELIIK